MLWCGCPLMCWDGALFIPLAGFVTISFDTVNYDVIESDMMVQVCVSLSAAYFESVSVSLIPKAISGGVCVCVHGVRVCAWCAGVLCVCVCISVSRCLLPIKPLPSQTQLWWQH